MRDGEPKLSRPSAILAAVKIRSRREHHVDDHNKNEQQQEQTPMDYPGPDRRRAGAAAARARAHYVQVKAGLMARPPLQRWLLIGLWSLLTLIVLFAIYVALLFPLTPGIEDLKQARGARPTVVMS